MPGLEHPVHRGSLFRPLAPYEPSARRREQGPCPGQLALPLRSARTSIGPTRQALRAADPALRWPNDDALARLVGALVEVTSGRRPIGPLRKHLSDRLCRELPTKPHPGLGHPVVVRRVHRGHGRAGVLEICAMVEDVATGRVVGAAACLEANWHGWRLSEFDFVLSQPARHRAAA